LLLVLLLLLLRVPRLLLLLLQPLWTGCCRQTACCHLQVGGA
jgi:hypothetical protein